MPFKKGMDKVGGRKKGVQNKGTDYARKAIGDFVNGNIDRMTEWLDQIAKDDPKAAFDCIMKASEYHMPKLARTEHTGKDGDDLLKFDKIEVVLVKPEE